MSFASRPTYRFTNRYLSEAQLQQYGLPLLPYPLLADTPSPADAKAPFPLAEMLFALQCKTAEDRLRWQKYEDAMNRLIQLLAADDKRSEILVQSEQWQCLAAPVDLAAPIVTIQRGDELVLAMAGQHPQLLKACAYLPLDRDALELLRLLCQKPEFQQHHVSRDCFQRAVEMTYPKMAVAMTADAGNSYRSHWSHPEGLGVSKNGDTLPIWYHQRSRLAQPAAWLAVQLEVFKQFDERSDKKPVPPKPTPKPVAPMPWWKPSKPHQKTLIDRSRAILLAGALGETLALARINAHEPDSGASRPANAPGAITQMSLLTAEGLIRATTRLADRGITTYEGVVARCYKRWADMQLGKIVDSLDRICHGWLVDQPVMQARTPSNMALLKALSKNDSASPLTRPFSQGSNALSRIAAVAIFTLDGWPSSPEHTWYMAMDIARLTHEGPQAASPAGAFALLLRSVLEGVALEQAMGIVMNFLTRADTGPHTQKAILYAQTLARKSNRPAEIYPPDDANQTLRASLHIALTAGSFMEGLQQAAALSPAAASLTGQLMAAKQGLNALPGDGLETLEYVATVQQLGSDLVACKQWQTTALYTPESGGLSLWERYPGC